MATKTIPVATIVEWVNTRLACPDSTTRVQDLTPEQAMRVGAYSLLEQILHHTGNYKGFGFLESEFSPATQTRLRPDYDETRRRYFYPKGT